MTPLNILLISSIVIQINANRLLNQVHCTKDASACPDGSFVGRDSNNNCEWFPCPDGTCITKDKCVNPNTNQCEPIVKCFADPCTVSDPGCKSPEVCVSNYCGGCHATCEVPTCASSNPCRKNQFCDDTKTGPECFDHGETCGYPPNDCPALKCVCGLCPNGRTHWGCCGTCVVEESDSGVDCSGIISKERSCKCGGYGNKCVAYNDGCNDCTCNNDGTESCTEKNCLVYDTPKCITCANGYIMNSDSECVKLCSHLHCTKNKGYKCKKDPICKKQWNKNKYCDTSNPPKVCVDETGLSCNNDADCEYGYICVGTRKPLRYCVRYE